MSQDGRPKKKAFQRNLLKGWSFLVVWAALQPFSFGLPYLLLNPSYKRLPAYVSEKSGKKKESQIRELRPLLTGAVIGYLVYRKAY